MRKKIRDWRGEPIEVGDTVLWTSEGGYGYHERYARYHYEGVVLEVSADRPVKLLVRLTDTATIPNPRCPKYPEQLEKDALVEVQSWEVVVCA